MKAHAAIPVQVGAGALVGRVLCHDVREAGKLLLRKGEVLDVAAAERLAALVHDEVHLIEMEAGDLHEDPAGQRLAAAAAGPGVSPREAAGGQWALVAERRGLLRVDADALAEVNGLEGVSIYTLYDQQVVDAGEVVARAKVTPLVVAEEVVREAEARCRRARPLVAVRGFLPLAVAALALDTLEPRVRSRFEAVLREKVRWFGVKLAPVRYVADRLAALATAMEAARTGGADLVVAAGANTLDPLDPVFAAIDALGGRVLRKGVPAHPGSLLWVAMIGGTPVLGMPSCGMFSQATLFDLLLPRLLAGELVGEAELAAFGHGGLLGREMSFRFPPYRAGQERGAVPE